ncbi:amidoligase family protein [Tropicibacter naphthalenivorans]|uniref:Putative amidoligase enzyme n=1 Tax=Tropicibacter naphthalenivorans TaxID=441103 RepID=A0A0P1G1L0_9RHOB|nr:amidoligase family protein [Tropicibacter naphthalenivorans]CUH75652.1 Putative amidoligase enzyme [Tropicibacter naphthalenivorans]SMC42994.1 Putative amidoligase enzyme [Tropicibacter naphthalenivorans]
MTTDFRALPGPDTRLCGVEIEFAGLSETATADVLKKRFGGELVETGSHVVELRGTQIGTLEVELDTVLRKKDLPLLAEGLDLVRGLVPVEIVTDPLDADQVAAFDSALGPLREAGAMGSRSGVLLGFGVHLNPEIPSEAKTLDIIRAYGLLEDHLRTSAEIDATRRAMPFVDRWPKSLVTALVTSPPSDLRAAMRLYAQHTTSRNHGLDLLPLFKHVDEDLYLSIYDNKDKTAARPTFHFRLPDSRIDEPDWSLHQAWDMWRLVEDVAAEMGLLGTLGTAWLDTMGSPLARRAEWARTVAGHLDKAGLMGAQA